MKNQALFSSKDKSKELKCCMSQFLFGVLRVKIETEMAAAVLRKSAVTLELIERV